MKSPDYNVLDNIQNYFSFRFISQTIIIILLIGSTSLYSQIANDFIIADSGSVPSIKSDLNDGIYIAWQNLNDAVYQKHIDFEGNTIGNTIKYSGTYASIDPRISVNNKSDNIIVWEDEVSTSASIFNTYIQGNINLVNELDTNNYEFDNGNGDFIRARPDIGFLYDTSFVVVWSGNGDSTIYNSGIYGQIVSTSLNRIGDNFLITDHYKNNTNNLYPRIISLGQKKYFMVTWEDNSSGRYNLYGRKFNLNGTPLGSSFLISDDTAMTYMYYYSVAKDTAGNFVVVWFADKGKKSQMEWRWYNSGGSPSTNVEQITPLDSVFSSGSTIDVSIEKDGKFIIEWEQFDSNQIKIFGQRFLADKNKLGTPFRVAANNTASNEIYANVVLSSDTIFSVWQEGNGIEGNIFDFNNITAVNKNDLSANQITSYSLFQNYPNPFNPSTIISYQLSVFSHVKLDVFNVLGEKVAELVNKEQTAGTQRVPFNASNFASGVYIYQLNAGNYTSTKKMVLLK
jgi:hypothetical protein